MYIGKNTPSCVHDLNEFFFGSLELISGIFNFNFSLKYQFYVVNSKTFVYLSALYETRHGLKYTSVKMSPNLSILHTGFRLFRNSNLLSAYKHVANSYIVANLYIYFVEDSYN